MNGVETGRWVKYLWEYDRAQHLSTESSYSNNEPIELL